MREYLFVLAVSFWFGISRFGGNFCGLDAKMRDAVSLVLIY